MHYTGPIFRPPYEADLAELRESNPNIERIYLLNGDPVVLSFEKLKPILLKIKEYLPKYKSISKDIISLILHLQVVAG